MLKRTITALLGIPVLLYIILTGGNLLKLTLIGVSLVGIYEIYNAFEKNYKPMRIVGYISAIVLLLNSLYIKIDFELILILIIIIFLGSIVIKYPKYTIIDLSITIFSVLYIAFLFPFIYYTREMEHGNFLIWIIFISAWGTDTFAYFTGYFLGKNKLAPLLSPKKTIEGSIGGIIGAYLLALVYVFLYSKYINPSMSDYMLLVPIISAVGSIVSQLGDLSASSIKRFLNVKDFGYILPGHGGILDRFDSVILAAPFIYCALVLLF